MNRVEGKNHLTNIDLIGKRMGITGFLLGFTMLLVSACGGDSGGGSDEAQIRDTVETFFNYTFLGKGSADTAYNLLDEESRGNCTKEQFTADAKDARDLFSSIGGEIKLESVKEIKVNGDKATAKIDVSFAGESSDSADEPVPFAKEGGKWRIVEGC